MRAINHAVTGALIGLSVSEPAAALPLALVSHYVLDVIPHHGGLQKNWLRSSTFRRLLIIDAVLCMVFVVLLALAHPANWRLAALCAFVAAAPDFLSINHYLQALRRQAWRPGLYSRFAKSIQWFERPIGAVVEIGWFVAILILLMPFLR